MSTNPLLAALEEERRNSNPLLRALAEERQSKATNKNDGPDWKERVGDWITDKLTSGNNVSAEMIRNAKSGRFKADAAKDDGFFDFLASKFERGAAGFDQGLYTTIGALTGSRKAQEAAKTLGEGTTNQKIAGAVEWDDLKNKPSLSGLGKYVAGGIAESAPGTAVAAVPYIGVPALAGSLSGSIAADRAKNNGRDEITAGDVLKAAPAALASAALERIGVKGAAQVGTSTVGKGLLRAAGKEAATEFGQGVVENAGGSLGTDKGFDARQAIDEGIAGAVVGAAMGGAVHTGSRGGQSAVGRIKARRQGAPEQVGTIEQAKAEASVLTPEDEASPLAAHLKDGKQVLAEAAAQTDVDARLEAAGLPKLRSAIEIVDAEGAAVRGTVEDVFDGGFKLKTEEGGVLDYYLDDINDAGDTIRPAAPRTAEEINAAAAARAEEAQANMERLREEMISAPEIGSDLGNGYVQGPNGYRVQVADSPLGLSLQKRKDGATPSAFLVDKDGRLIDADNVNHLTSLGGHARDSGVWTGGTKEQRAQAANILRQMAVLDLKDPARKVLAIRLQEIVTGKPLSTAPVRAAPTAQPAVQGDAAIEGFKARTRRAESGGSDSAKNPNSSATGRYQFVEGTFKQVFRKVYGGTDADAQAAWISQRNDPNIQERLMDRLTRDNAAGLQRAGIPVTEGNLYLAHFAGIGGATKLHNNPNASVETVLGEGAVKANSFLRGKSARDVISWAAQKMGGKEVLTGLPVQEVDRQDQGVWDNPYAQALENYRQSQEQAAEPESDGLLPTPARTAEADLPNPASIYTEQNTTDAEAQADGIGREPHPSGGEAAAPDGPFRATVSEQDIARLPQDRGEPVGPALQGGARVNAADIERLGEQSQRPASPMAVVSELRERGFARKGPTRNFEVKVERFNAEPLTVTLGFDKDGTRLERFNGFETVKSVNLADYSDPAEAINAVMEGVPGSDLAAFNQSVAPARRIITPSSREAQRLYMAETGGNISATEVQRIGWALEGGASPEQAARITKQFFDSNGEMDFDAAVSAAKSEQPTQASVEPLATAEAAAPPQPAVAPAVAVPEQDASQFSARPTGMPVGGYYATDGDGNPLVRKGEYGETPPRFPTEAAAIAAAPKLQVRATAPKRDSRPQDDLVTVSVKLSDWGALPKAGPARLSILRGRVSRWYRGLIGSTVSDREGRVISFNAKGMEKTPRVGEDLLLVARAIPKVLARGTRIETQPGRGKGVVAVHKYAANVRDEEGNVRSVVAVVRETADGRFHYSYHNLQKTSSDAPTEAGGVKPEAGAPALDGYAEDRKDLASGAAEVNESGLSRNDQPASRRDLKNLERDLNAAVQKVAGKRVQFVLTTRAELGKGKSAPDGRFDPSTLVIEVAADAISGAKFTTSHELVHALRKLGAISPTDWMILSNAARKDGKLMDSVKRRYPDLNEEAQVEEAIADMFGRYQDKRDSLGPVGRGVTSAFRKVQQFLEAVRNVLKGQGFTYARTSGDVMSDMRAGEMALDAAPEVETEQVAKESRPDIAPVLDLAGTDPSWKGKAEVAFEKFRMAMQDRYLPLKKAQRKIEQASGAPIPDSMDVYKGEELMHGRMAERLDRLQDEQVRPLFDDMAEAKVTVEELETYLYARHARERNAQIAKINPEMPDGGSGMTNTQARAVLNRISKSDKAEAMQRLAAKVDAIREDTLNKQVEYGLISAERAAEMRATYQHYVPLRGFKEVDGDPASAERINRSGGGINVRGPETKRAFGRRSEADSPLAYLILQAESAIVRGETNRVAQEFLELAKANPDPEFWQVQKAETKRRLNEDTGLVENYVVNRLTAQDAPYTVVAKVDGKEVRVTLNRDNEAARRMADAMRRLTDQKMDAFTKYAGAINRWMSAVNTRFNPEFVFVNLMRDLQTAAINVNGLDVDGIAGKAAKHYPGAMKAAAKGAFGRRDGEWGKWYNEFALAGAKTAYAQIENVEQIKDSIEKDFALAASRAGQDPSVGLKLKRAGKKVLDVIENVNDGVENGARLAAYRAARESGLSEKQAASIAKNLTVNFNRRGQMGPALNALYLFYNASVQGNVRILQAMYHSKKVRGIVAGIAVAGLMSELLNSMASDDDEDGESFYDKIPAFTKERNIIIMQPNGRDYIKIPMPWGYNVFWEMGRTTAEIGRRGGDRWQKSAATFATTVLGAFNPIGFNFEGRSAQEAIISFLAPSWADPVVDLSQNRDFAGKPIMPEESAFGPSDPDFRRYWPGVNPVSKTVTDFLNYVSGGNKVEAGAIDISPETLDYLGRTLFGAAGGLAMTIGAIPSKVAKGELGPNDIPLARKGVGSKSPFLDKATFYDRKEEIEALLKTGKDLEDAEMGEELDAFVEKNRDLLSLEPALDEASKTLRQIRKDRRENDGLLEKGEIDQADYAENKKVLDEAEAEAVTAFNAEYVATVYKGSDTESE